MEEEVGGQGAGEWREGNWGFEEPDEEDADCEQGEEDVENKEQRVRRMFC